MLLRIYTIFVRFFIFYFFLLLSSVRTDLTEVGANSTLSVAKINKFDSGESKYQLDSE